MIRKLLRFNWLSFGAMIALVVIGTLTIKSAGGARDVFFHDKWIDNLQTAVFGLAIYAVLAFVDYRRYLSWLSLPAYVGAVLLLVLVLLVGSSQMGGKRWLWFFQPSEVAKLCVLAFLSQVFGSEEFSFRGRFGFRGFLVAAGLAGLPALLILMEPDLGTTLALVPAVIVILLVAGVWRKGIVTMMGVGVLLAATLLGSIYEAEKPGAAEKTRQSIRYYLGAGDDRRTETQEKRFALAPLKPHQYGRIQTFLFPEGDRTGGSYNYLQARIAIASGGVWGKGFGKGETNHLKYLPQSVSMNDFIFCVCAEEQGYMGSLALLGLFAVLCLSGVWTAGTATDLRGRLMALGVSTLIFAHVYVNIAMSIGLVPITGLPLPFISSGRTFLVIVMAGLGIVQSISIHREEFR